RTRLVRAGAHAGRDEDPARRLRPAGGRACRRRSPRASSCRRRPGRAARSDPPGLWPENVGAGPYPALGGAVSRLGAMRILLEGSKAFSTKLMRAAGVPTARAMTCTDVASARTAVDELGGACVVKADGLAAGKGVAVCLDRASALEAIADCLVAGAFGEAGRT